MKAEILNKTIALLDLDELRTLRQVSAIETSQVTPAIDVSYVLAIVEKLEQKVNEIISSINNDGAADIKELELKLNEVIGVVNAQGESARALAEHLATVKPLSAGDKHNQNSG